MPIKVKYTKKNSDKNLKSLTRMSRINSELNLDYYGKLGVSRLRDATPIDTGLTANSWDYEITKNNNKTLITWYNTNVNKNINIAIIIDQGHATRSGTWVKGRNYIKGAIEPVYEELNKFLEKEVGDT